ncbi:MAG TPA: 50S ribosomal protein L17 [Kosmotogaceae bacterium]|nr:MAG: 50S ribosomal protein L17 [Thermotogales bacterium 46_20]HAA85275.1 50S ribosomal protein L17 [Kosmotogaceae bacterium]
MRHRVKKGSLNRPHSHRVSLMKNLARELFEHGTIVTTTTKAKAVRPFVETIITRAKKAAVISSEIDKRDPNDTEIVLLKSKNLSLRREINRNFNDRRLVRKICDEIAVKYIERNGGYTRIVRLGQRRGDATELAILQLVDRELPNEKKKK